MKKELSKMSDDEKSLLLFFESAAVDYGGKLNTAHMNDNDMQIAKQWTIEGFVVFSRIASKFLVAYNGITKTHSVVLSKEAWDLAQDERRERFKRIYSKGNWLTTDQYRKCDTQK